MKRLLVTFMIVMLCNMTILYANINTVSVSASVTNSHNVDMNQESICIDDAFGIYQQTIDKNIYSEMNKYVYDILIEAYGEYDTPIMRKAKETINPCMAFATTWGEAGQSYGGISLTTIMDFNPATYVHEIDWINVTSISCRLMMNGIELMHLIISIRMKVDKPIKCRMLYCNFLRVVPEKLLR